MLWPRSLRASKTVFLYNKFNYANRVFKFSRLLFAPYYQRNMREVGLMLGLFALIIVLFGVLLVLQKKRTYYVPEGFTTEVNETEYPTADYKEIKNPITKVLKKIGGLSMYFANPTVWIDVIKHSNMSITDLARMQIEKDRAAAASATVVETNSETKSTTVITESGSK